MIPPPFKKIRNIIIIFKFAFEHSLSSILLAREIFQDV